MSFPIKHSKYIPLPNVLTVRIVVDIIGWELRILSLRIWGAHKTLVWLNTKLFSFMLYFYAFDALMLLLYCCYSCSSIVFAVTAAIASLRCFFFVVALALLLLLLFSLIMVSWFFFATDIATTVVVVNIDIHCFSMTLLLALICVDIAVAMALLQCPYYTCCLCCVDVSSIVCFCLVYWALLIDLLYIFVTTFCESV